MGGMDEVRSVKLEGWNFHCSLLPSPIYPLLIDLAEAFRKSLEVADLEPRILALEEKLKYKAV